MTANGSPASPPGALSASLDPRTSTLVLAGPIARSGIADLCVRVRLLLVRCRVDSIECDIGAFGEPDAATLEALARLQLTAGRLGKRLRFRGACGSLRDLVGFAGLGEVLPCDEASAVEPRGQAEQREQALGVEEEADPGDRAS